MAQKLADETVHQILTYVLDVPDEDFSDLSGLASSPFARRRHSTADVLHACKRWARIGTPLLYETVVIRSDAQAQALACALAANPTFAPFVKKMRFESGFGPALAKALRAAAAALRDVHICLDVNSQDDVEPMYAALKAINPTRLLLSALWHHHCSTANTLLSRIRDASTSWTNLTTLVFPSTILQRTHIVREVLLRLPHISSIHMSGHLFSLHQLARFLKAWPSCVIHFAASNATRNVEGLEPFLAAHSRRFLVRWNNGPVYAKANAPPPMHGAPPEVQRKIWTLILSQCHGFDTPSHRGFAFRSLRPLEPPPWRCHAIRYMRVCKLFLDIYSALAATSVALRSHSVARSFTRYLRRRATIPVHTVMLNGRDLDYQRRDLVALLRLICQCNPPGTSSPSLRVLGCVAPLSDIAMLSDKLSASLEELNICLAAWGDLPSQGAVSPNLNLTQFSFEFQALRRLFIGFAAADPDDPPPPPYPLSFTLPSLEELALATACPPWVVSAFIRTTLPKLHILTFLPRGDSPGDESFRSFLASHGAQCEDVRTRPRNLEAALSLCPNLRTLVLSDVEEVPPLRALAVPHPTLATLELPDLASTASDSYIFPFMMKREMAAYLDKMSEFFDAVSRAPDALPALRVIVGGRLEWPVIPRRVAGDLAVAWAEVLLEKGIQLVDEHGVGWRPRLKATRED